MVVKARSYLKTFDLTNMTAEAVYKMVMRCVRTAMMVPEEEEVTRQTLKRKEELEINTKHAKMLTTGILGKTRNFIGMGTNHQLPPVPNTKR